MKSTEQGISGEWYLGTAMALIMLLVNSENPSWRVLILVATAVSFGAAMRKSQWIKRTNPVLTLRGEPFPDDGENVRRKMITAYAFMVVAVAVFGFVTWPPRYTIVPSDAIMLPGSATSETQNHTWTPKGILPNASIGSNGKSGSREDRPATGIPITPLRPASPNPPTGLTATAQ